MAGEGMVAVVRGLRDAGLAVTLLDGNRQYTLLPNSITAPATTQRSQPMNANASTQPIPRLTAESSTESAALQCDRDSQAVDGRYTTMYKSMHCNVRPTSPPVQLTEFPPQRPDICPGHGNFQVGGAGSGAVNPHGKLVPSSVSFRGGLSWPDRGSVCSARPSIEVDAFANSLRKYPCLSAERSSEVMERLINYQARGFSKTSSRNQGSPTRISDSYPCSYHNLESKGTYTKGPRLYDQEITPRRKMEEFPTRERKKEDSYDMRNMRNYEVRCVRDMARRGKDNVRSYSGTPYCNLACPTIKETQDYQPIPQEYQNSSNSVNMEIQAAVKMISKEVATVQRDKLTRKTVAVPESPTMSATEDNVEGECYLVRKLDTSMSIKSIQTSFFPSDSTLKPRKSALTIASTLDFQSTRHKTVVSRKSKSQEQIKITKEELKKSLLELIEEVSKTSKCKKLIRDELIKKLFVSNGNERAAKENRRYKKIDQCHKYASTFCPTACDYVGDYQELLGRLKHCYGDIQQVLRSEVPPFRISEYRQLDFVLKDWINNLDIKTVDRDYMDRRELMNSLEDKIKILFKSRTKQDFDLKSAIVNIIEEIPIEMNSSYNKTDYLHKLVDMLMKRMKNVIVGQQYGRSRKKPYSKFKKVLTEADIRKFIREHLFDFFHENNLRTCDQVLVNLENELLDVIIDTIDCIRSGHIEDARNEMNLIFQEFANFTEKQAKYVASMILRDLQEVLNHCNFNHTYMILNMNNNSGPSNKSNYNDNDNVERITSDELRVNLDRYTNQLCQQINQWLDSLDIPQIEDTGFREVVVNDLAGDIIDRSKYLELNNTVKNRDEDELEALKYQIFKWINKLVGDDNQETIGNARILLDKIRSVPVPILVHPKTPRYTIVECPNPDCYGDPMKPCLGESGPGTCSEINRKLRPPIPPCAIVQEVPCVLGPCCDRDTCPEVVKSERPAKYENKTYCTNLDCTNLDYPRGPQPQQQPQTFANAYQSPQTQGSDRDKYSTASDSQYGPDKQLPYNQDKSYTLEQEQPQRFPSAYQSPQGLGGATDKYSTSPGNQQSQGKKLPYNQDQSFGLGQFSEPLNKEWTSDTNDKSNAYGPMESKRPYMKEPIQQLMHDATVGPSGITKSPQGAQTSVPIAPGPARPTPLPSSKKIYADYDAYLKNNWVQRVPIPMNTPSEKQAADKARLDLYNGVWKTITKMKLDPKIFGNPLYFKEVFNEEIEKLMKNLPKSKQLETEKPALKAELLKKTIEMNDLIRSLNVSGTYKQQVIDCIENNSPRRPALANETDLQNEEIEKHSVADYYILHRRYKDDDNVKANFHKKIFLTSLDDYLENIKKRHGLEGMETYGYANEIINCLDKIPIPNLLALRDEADEILLGMEVENWLSDLPQNSDTTGPLDKRRIRDSVVKKIQEVETYVNCYDDAFGDQLKADLPKYIERIPIKENTNINFIIDELVNRVRNLENMRSIRARSVSFQEPRGYEDFARNVTRASSFHETPEQDPRSWVASNVPPPMDDQWQSMQATRVPPDLRDWSQTTPESYAHSRPPMDDQWQSMQATRVPPDLRDWSQTTPESYVHSRSPMDDQWQSMQATRVPPNLRDWPQTPSESYAHSRNLPSQVVVPPSHSRSDYGSPRHLPSVAPGQFPPGQEYYNPSAQSGNPPSHSPIVQNNYPPNAQELFDPYNPGDVCMGPCCLNPVCVNKLQGNTRQMQYSQPSTSPFISPGGYAPGMSGQRGVAPPDGAVPSGLPQSAGQVNLNPYSCESSQPVIRCRGPTARYYQEQYQRPASSMPGSQMYSRVTPPPAPYPPPANVVPTEQVQYMPNVQGAITDPYQAVIRSQNLSQAVPVTFPDQGRQQLQDIPALQIKRYTQGISVAPQERRPSEPHVFKGPIKSTSMEKQSVRPPVSSQGRHSLGHYIQSKSNDPINVIPDTRRTSQVSAVSPQERRFSEFSKNSISNGQYTSPELKTNSEKPVDLQDKRYTEPHIQNIRHSDTPSVAKTISRSTAVSSQPSRFAENLSQKSPQISQATAISPQGSRYSETQTQTTPSSYTDRLPEIKKISKATAVSPQESHYSEPQTPSKTQSSEPQIQVVPNAYPQPGLDSVPPVRKESIKSNRDVSTQVSPRDSQISPQVVTPDSKSSGVPSEGIPKSPLNSPPRDQKYSEVPKLVAEEPVSQELHEQKPPSLLSSAPASRIPSLDQGSQLPYNQGDSIRVPSFKNEVQDNTQAEAIPPVYEEPKSHELTFPDTQLQDPYNNIQYVSSQEPEIEMTYQEPHLTTMGNTEVSYEQPIVIIPGRPTHISEIIPYDQMSPKGYSSPTSRVVTYEPAFQMDPCGSPQTGEVIPCSQFSPNYIKNPPQTSEIIPYIRVIESDQASQLQTYQPVCYDQILFNDLVEPQSDFIPCSQAIKIEAQSPIQVEQYPPNMAYEYIPDSISIEKTRFSFQPSTLNQASSQVPDQILEVYAPDVVGDMRMYETSQEVGPCAPGCNGLVRKIKPEFESPKQTSEEQPTFHKSTDSKDNSMSYNKKGTMRRENTVTEPINRKTKILDSDCDIFNIKSVQTAFSNVDIRTTKYCEIRSKSQEELTKITKKREVIKRRDHSGDFEPDMMEWFEIHSDKVKVKLWGDKLKKLVDNLKKPGGEEKVRNKIEKYLKQVPEQFSEGDDDKMAFRKQLPNDIIRKLKKMQFAPIGTTNINVYRMELSKYSSRFKVENFRKAVLNWTKTLNIKKTDFLGRNVKKEDVLRYVAERLEPIVLDRPQSDTKYKEALKSNITDMVKELPLVLNTHNNEFYLNKITENLMNDIFNIESKSPSTYIQPTIKEIKEFVRDEITFFLEKSRVAISTKRMEYLELELIDILLDLGNTTDIDEYVMEDVTTLFKVTGKLPEYKAKYFTNLLLKDYKEFFFRESFFHVKGNSDRGRPDVYSVFHNVNGIDNVKEEKLFGEYTQHLIDAINKWISKLTILNNDKKVIEVIVRDLANDIVDRYKFLLLNPDNKPTDFEELEYLKFLIFKWTNKLIGEENITILEHADELMNEIKTIPKPNIENTCPQSIITHHADGLSDKNYTEALTAQILKWYQDLPSELHLIDNSNPIKSIKHVVEEIEKGLSSREDGVVDKTVAKWVETVFKNKLNIQNVEQLTSKIVSVPYTNENIEKDPKFEKVLIRSYEDLVDEWIDTVPIDPKKVGIFTDNKNEIVHDIAVKISKIKTKIKNTPLEVMQKKLSEELSYWLKKLPLHAKVDKETFRDKYTEKLVQKLQSCNVEESLNKTPVMNNETFQIEEVLIEWLKRRPFYKNKTPEVKKHQEEIIKELGNKLKADVDQNPDADEYIIECISKLEPNQNQDILQNIVCQLKLYLDKFNIKGCNTECIKKDSNLYNNIELWLNNLPLHVTDEKLFKEQKTQFIESIQLLKTPVCDSSIIKKEILIFMKSLPIDREKKEDIHFMNQEASNLIEHLKSVPADHVTDEITENKPKNETNDVIKDWVHSLPLKSVYCPREFNSFIDDMTCVINRIVLDSNSTEQSNEELLKEIVKFLRRFPLDTEQNTENDMTTMAEMLIKSLDKSLRQNKRCTETNSVTVYALKNTNLTGFGLPNVKDSDINENLNTYTKQLANQIGQWLDNLSLPTMLNDSYKEVAINDLAGDIADRHKYLELNSNAKEDELEQLKYQIFKWINKLVGEENLKTITHADDLMRRIKKIPVPMLVRPEDKIQAQSAFSNIQYRSDVRDSTVAELSLGAKNNIDTTTSPIEMNLWQQVYLQQIYTKPREASPHSGVRQSNSPTNLSNTSHSYSSSYSQSRPPDAGSKEAVYEKYQKIFKDKCNALPIDSSTPENAKLAELAKTAIYNGIIKTFFNLKADPEIENDYGYFELMLEEKVDELLDVLPQSLELINQRHAWKVDIVTNALDMLEQLHSFSDRPSFRQRVRNKFNRKFAKELELEQCFLLQQGFLAEMVDAYILETNYKEKDELKANIYKKRLMQKVDELANHLAKEHNVGFRFFNKDQLTDIAMKVLEQVPKPGEDILQEEAEEIQLGDEVEKWYKDLPTKPLVNDTDGVLRKRMMDLLAKKLYDIHKRHKADGSTKEMKMKHEVSLFLEKRAQLQDDQDLNINAMVEDLNNRIKNRWLKEPQDYYEFERDRPISSTFAQVNNREIPSSSMEAGTSTGRPPQDEEYFIRPGQQMQNMNSSPGASYYNKQERSGRHSHEPIFVQNPSYGHETFKGNSYAGHLNTNHAPQAVSGQTTDHRFSQPAYAPRTGPERYGSPQRGSLSMQEPRGSINLIRPNYTPYQYVPKHVTLTNGQRPNTSQLSGTPGQLYVPHQSPNLSQNVANNVSNGHGTFRSNQMSAPRIENVSQHHGQNTYGPPRQDPNLLHVPNYQRPSQGTPTARYGSPGTHDPSSHGGATAEVLANGGEEDAAQYRCRCLELLRPRRMCFDQRSDMYHLCPQ